MNIVVENHAHRRKEDQGKNLHRYTAFIAFHFEGGEEIDVDAPDSTTARSVAEAVLKSDYEPGGKIRKIVERFGLYM